VCNETRIRPQTYDEQSGWKCVFVCLCVCVCLFAPYAVAGLLLLYTLCSQVDRGPVGCHSVAGASKPIRLLESELESD